MAATRTDVVAATIVYRYAASRVDRKIAEGEPPPSAIGDDEAHRPQEFTVVHVGGSDGTSATVAGRRAGVRRPAGINDLRFSNHDRAATGQGGSR